MVKWFYEFAMNKNTVSENVKIEKLRTKSDMNEAIE